MNLRIDSKKLTFGLIFLITFIALSQNFPFALSSQNDASLEINTEFEMTEFSRADGIFISTNSIDFELPSASWGIDDLELNFTNVEFGIEQSLVEGTPTDKYCIDKFHDGYAVQIAIQDPTIIYGVSVYGNNESTEGKPIYIQVNGYDNLTNSPNNIVYGNPIVLNMSFSLIPSWHLQTFSIPIFLPEGDYYLVINGSSIGNSPKSDYFWYFNDVNPLYPGIHISEYSTGSWTAGLQGTPFLYQIDQKVNYTFFPEDINMTAELNGKSYDIINVNHPGKGYLKKSNLNYNPNNKDIKIKIKNNKTQTLEFNLTYSITVTNNFLAPSFLKIKNNASNEWSVNPVITRLSFNHYVNFSYPHSWSNIIVLKNQVDATFDVVIDSINKIISIPNHLIEDGADWEINAYSPQVNINLNVPRTNWIGDQDLYFSIADPTSEGTYEFILMDQDGIQIHRDNLTFPGDDNIFTYRVPSNILEGDYTGCIYWYNQTDAGFQSQIFSLSPQVSTSKPLDFSLILTVGLVVVGGTAIGGTSYVKIKKKHSKRVNQQKLIMEKCSEIMDIEYIIVLHKKSGIDVYSEAFGEKKVEPTLISGFLQAIQNFGSEVLGRAKESKTFKIEYQKSMLIMSEFVNLRLIVIMKNSPSKNFLYTIESLAYDIYHNYGHLFEEFQGNLGEFQGIKDLLEKHLSISFLYPLTINYSIKMKLTQSERDLMKKALDVMKTNNSKHFSSNNLFRNEVCTPKDFETIQRLIEKKIFTPIDIEVN
ncbi:MAG: hypothetical protein ACW986_18845 [Promethearchaeota archaeon]|jgi:hypothetical protein